MNSNGKSGPSLHDVIAQAQVLARGDGAFRIIPRRPTSRPAEVTTKQACEMLGVSRATMWALRNHPIAGKILVWRFTSPCKRKVMFTAASVLNYLAYTNSPAGKAGEEKAEVAG